MDACSSEASVGSVSHCISSVLCVSKLTALQFSEAGSSHMRSDD